MREFFTAVARKTTAEIVGAYWVFMAAILLVVGWAATGQIFHYSYTWQLVINTATTIITFLMVFVIQNTQNRDSRAMQIKLIEDGQIVSPNSHEPRYDEAGEKPHSVSSTE